MKIVYPYNEILPKKKAHDVYIFNNCLSLADLGFDVHLLCGKGSYTSEKLFEHYDHQYSNRLQIHALPIIRKNNVLNLSWNRPFFSFSQKFMNHASPQWILFSVLKQASFHLKNRVSHTRYAYEVHQLNWYPGQPLNSQKIQEEKYVFQRCNLIVTTTQALKNILQSPPYSISTPIEVVPLAVKACNLPLPAFSNEMTLGYVGQLYPLQGVPLLLEALSHTSSIKLKIIGGKPEEIAKLERRARELNISSKVSFLGFKAPHALYESLLDVHAFIAPFLAKERMPFVAHTKLLEYAVWNRPIVVPDLPICHEHLNSKVTFYFKPESPSSLANTLCSLFLKYSNAEISQIPSPDFGWPKRAEAYSQILKNYF